MELPAAIRRCAALQVLDLSHNRLLVLTNGLAALRALTELDVSANPIRELPLTLTSLRDSLRTIRAEAMHLKVPPLEVTREGTDAIYDYLAQHLKSTVKSCRYAYWGLLLSNS